MNTACDEGTPATIERLEQYWTETLAPLTPSPGLPPDYPRQPGPAAIANDTIDVPIDAAMARAAMEACQAKPALLCGILVTACDLLLHRLNAAEQVSVLTPVTDIGVGATGTNRWLVVKNVIDPDETIGQLVERVRNTLAGAFTHQQFPFSRVLDLLGRDWPRNRAPLSDVAVAVEGLSRMDVLSDVATDLTILGSMAGAACRLRIAYRTDLFAVDTVLGFGRRLAHVLGLVLASPESRVRDVRLMTAEEEAEAAARLRAWSGRELPRVRVEDLVVDTARAAPDATALIEGEKKLTYRELVDSARALARVLHNKGVRSGDRVAIALDSSMRIPIALLGTLFCGAAFVPLDPRHPMARLQAIVSRVKPAAVLAEERLRGALAGVAQIVEWDVSTAPRPAPGEIAPDGGDEAIAYVMFTSGSTGEPNGVAVSHRSLVNYLAWAKDYYLRGERPGFALYSSIAFDLTLTSIFLPLLSGCATVIFKSDDIVDMNAVFADERVGVVKATPSHLRLLRIADMSRTRVRRVIVGGETFDWELARSLQDAIGEDGLVFNEYGPTEATIACSAHQFAASDRRGGSIPIGAPIWNTGLYLLDEERRPTAPGMTGDLYIAGVALAAGYFDDADRTSERFVDDPFQPGRMYVTGDRARCDAARRLFFVGRADDQVKFKGVRIELSEVRAALVRLPRIRDAIVRVVDDERRNQIMIAYYVARQTIDVSILRAGLSELLPQEMIPNLFVRLARLPLTLNGKIDVDRLPSLDEARSRTPQLFVTARTETEKAVAAVWSEVIGIPDISIHSNFFELGGHSLLASQVASRTTERLGVEMPLRLLFDAPTVAQLSALLDERRAVVSAPPHSV